MLDLLKNKQNDTVTGTPGTPDITVITSYDSRGNQIQKIYKNKPDNPDNLNEEYPTLNPYNDPSSPVPAEIPSDSEIKFKKRLPVIIVKFLVSFGAIAAFAFHFAKPSYLNVFMIFVASAAFAIVPFHLLVSNTASVWEDDIYRRRERNWRRRNRWF